MPGERLPDTYPLPNEFLCLDEPDLLLWDFLLYKASWGDGTAVFERHEVCDRDPRLLSQRHQLNRWLERQRRNKAIELHDTDYATRKEYLVAIQGWHDYRRRGIPKPRGYHANGWVHELIGLEEHWLLNLFLAAAHRSGEPLALLTIDALRDEVRARAAGRPGSRMDRLASALEQSVRGLVESELVIPENGAYRLDRAAFARPAAPRYWQNRHDHTAQQRCIAARIAHDLGIEVSPASDAVRLIRLFHEAGGVRLREMAELYLYLEQATDLDYERVANELERRRAGNRDRSTRYENVLRDVRRARQHPTSARLKLRLDNDQIVYGVFRFPRPLTGHPVSLTLLCQPIWAGRFEPRAEQLALALWLEPHRLYFLGSVPSVWQGRHPLRLPVTEKIPGSQIDLAQPVTLLVRAPRPLPGLTLAAWLAADLPKRPRRPLGARASMPARALSAPSRSDREIRSRSKSLR